MIYQCPVCKVRADIDKEKRQLKLLVDKPVFSFPSHDCELAKSVDKIDLTKLEKLT